MSRWVVVAVVLVALAILSVARASPAERDGGVHQGPMRTPNGEIRIVSPQ